MGRTHNWKEGSVQATGNPSLERWCFPQTQKMSKTRCPGKRTLGQEGTHKGKEIKDNFRKIGHWKLKDSGMDAEKFIWRFFVLIGSKVSRHSVSWQQSGKK